MSDNPRLSLAGTERLALSSINVVRGADRRPPKFRNRCRVAPGDPNINISTTESSIEFTAAPLANRSSRIAQWYSAALNKPASHREGINDEAAF